MLYVYETFIAEKKKLKIKRNLKKNQQIVGI